VIVTTEFICTISTISPSFLSLHCFYQVNIKSTHYFIHSYNILKPNATVMKPVQHQSCFLQTVCSGIVRSVGQQLFAVLDLANDTVSPKDLCGMVNIAFHSTVLTNFACVVSFAWVTSNTWKVNEV
jgi:hypothetical protein